MAREAELVEAAKRVFSSPFDGVLRIEPEGAPAIWIDGRAAPAAVCFAAPPDAEAICVWRGGWEAIMRILEEERTLGPAFISARLAISGDMSVMARLRLAKAAHG